ncbi:cupin domain-containing protein [Pseudoteredinibacter isoporae]|uniref:50S ribosomal protein L16 3-hydroxylase n=1 Tax=Pseudoteredinibacter isoporae TaxID=570281 RepID=A0A7X0MVD1_9GAMM|nr:cupin domain-containing protein [Pseudoteredinibacter isoporae]MBB6521611.1 50S ribosomal protein L16 3-hydroxylase [Pseudoteredinibacter isoporae]NHO87165.1 cupin domain-containing protein [Pseudoteredinibacter isoporae]NIB22989.1 cupin domain-containing protein [Pseudoteredinibacter isoporae]
MGKVLTQLGDISVEQFLAEYWQQKPLLIRQALPGFESPLSPDELAGLSLEDDVESRIILENHQGAPWQLRKGPFDDKAYQELPETNWTLLVQALDLFVPELKELREQFQFLPDWRLDDIMASFAVDGGSVGPHYDHYDVFLLQGLGKRHWQVGQSCHEDSKRLDGTPLNILQEFQCLESYILEPGDILYLPPKVAHWGIAQGDCITYSVGFRAPSQGQLLEEHFQSLAENFSEFQRYEDPNIAQRAHSHELLPEDVERVRKILEAQLKRSDSAIIDWLGRLLSEAKYPDSFEQAENTSIIPQQLFKASDARCLFFRKDHQQAQLFINGELRECPLALAIEICESECIDSEQIATQFEHTESGVEFLQWLMRCGAFFEDDEE